MTQQLPLPCSSFSYSWTYDVFLSFRGIDTRMNFTGNLYNALKDKGIHTFIDDEELRRGEEITLSLLKAVEESRIALIIFSPNYASSIFCLEELVKILECIKQRGQLVWPIFYGVDPCDVRHQRGSYEKALAEHEARFKNNMEKVNKWRLALHEAANLSGSHFKDGFDYEYKFIGRIIEEVSKKINRMPLHITEYPIGLESRVQEVKGFLGVESDKVNMLGIYGVGGIGKSTIARATYNSIADQFEGLCFLADIREQSIKHGLVHLQETLLNEVLAEKNVKVGNVYEGISTIKRRISKKKVLLILDDVDKRDQLQKLAGGLDWFGCGSRIIITTRDQHLLHVQGVERKYEVKGFIHEEALELFSWNAFRKNEIPTTYMDMAKRAGLYSNGLPLALEIIGSNLSGRNEEEWESELDKYERFPDRNIVEILRISYDGLDDNEKEIFLDICFFGRYKLGDIKTMVAARGFFAVIGIRGLIDKSLVKIDPTWGFVNMHDLIRVMGREIVRKESPNPGECSRLCCSKDIIDILEKDMGTDKIKVIVFHLPEEKEVRWNEKGFKKMKNLEVLIIRNARFTEMTKHVSKSLRVLVWQGYPSSYLPSEFDTSNLVMLSLPKSRIILDKLLIKKFESLSHMDLSDCDFIKQVPNISGAAPNLRKLHLDCCISLTEVHESIGFLHELRELSAVGCSKLRNFPGAIKSTSLDRLDLSGCSSLQSFPKILGRVEDIRHAHFAGPGSSFLTTGRHDFERSALALVREKNYLLLSCSIPMLLKDEKFKAQSGEGQEQQRLCSMVYPNMRRLTLEGCNLRDKFLLTIISCFPNLEEIELSGDGDLAGGVLSAWLPCLSNLKSLRVSSGELTDEFLSAWLPWCPNLKRLHLSSKKLTDNFLFKRLPGFPNLEELSLSNNNFTVLPQCISEFVFLRKLDLTGCEQLREIREIPPNIKDFTAWDCPLTSESQRRLLSQTLHEGGGTYFKLRGTSIPEWFDFCSMGHSLSFWFRNKFPKIALCFVIQDSGDYNLHILINGTKHSFNFYKPFEAHNILLFDLQHRYDLGGEHKSIVITEDAWNHVEVSYEGVDNRIIKWMGVHVLKQTATGDDVRFINPNPPNQKTTNDDSWNSNNDEDFNGNSSFSKKKRKYVQLEIQVCDSMKTESITSVISDKDGLTNLGKRRKRNASGFSRVSSYESLQIGKDRSTRDKNKRRSDIEQLCCSFQMLSL